MQSSQEVEVAEPERPETEVVKTKELEKPIVEVRHGKKIYQLE